MTDVTVKRTENLRGEVCAPPSKAYTQRMLIAAALSKGTSKVSDPLLSEDTEATLRAVKALGAQVTAAGDCWTVEGADPLKGAEEPINCGESGATLRFMIPVAALAPSPTVFVLGKGLAKRPLAPLLESLKKLGAQTSIPKTQDKATVRVEGGGIHGGKTSLPGDVSSQFVSGLMFACPLAKADTELALTSPLESSSYVHMTQEVLCNHSVTVNVAKNFSQLKIPAKQVYQPVDGRVPGDFSSGAFLLAAAAITNSAVTVNNLDRTTAQGDKAILRILQKMGVKGKVCEDKVEINGDATLLGAIEVDARDIPDLVPVCAVLACYAKGTSRIHDAQRLRLKESDRLLALYTELRKMGAAISMDEDSLSVKGPCRLHGAVIDSHSDHRIAMACAVAALRAQGETVIQDAECVRKSYPQFFTDLHRIGANVDGGELNR